MVGDGVGDCVGEVVGGTLLLSDGVGVGVTGGVGDCVGELEGVADGVADGLLLGDADGVSDGCSLGCSLGFVLGDWLGVGLPHERSLGKEKKISSRPPPCHWVRSRSTSRATSAGRSSGRSLPSSSYGAVNHITSSVSAGTTHSGDSRPAAQAFHVTFGVEGRGTATALGFDDSLALGAGAFGLLLGCAGLELLGRGFGESDARGFSLALSDGLGAADSLALGCSLGAAEADGWADCEAEADGVGSGSSA